MYFRGFFIFVFYDKNEEFYFGGEYMVEKIDCQIFRNDVYIGYLFLSKWGCRRKYFDFIGGSGLQDGGVSVKSWYQNLQESVYINCASVKRKGFILEYRGSSEWNGENIGFEIRKNLLNFNWFFVSWMILDKLFKFSVR